MTVLPTTTRIVNPPSAGGRGRRIRLFWACLIAFQLLHPQSLPAAGNAKAVVAINQDYRTAGEEFRQKLEDLAVSCDQEQLSDLAKEIRQWAVPFDQQSEDVDQLPVRKQADLPADMPTAERAIREKLRANRVEYARQLYLLAKRSQKEKYSTFAYHCIREVLFHDPDHLAARGLSGYRLVNGEWTTAFAERMKRDGKVWDSRWGWIVEQNISRYEAGERFFEEQWIPVERERELRSEWKNAWKISTEHFVVKTNTTEEKGVELAYQAEKFHQYFMREFAAFFQTPQQLTKLFNGGAAKNAGELHVIHFYRNQTEFVAAIRKDCPVAHRIQGFYSPSDRISYFYHNHATEPETAMETLFHEVTHQLLGESTQQKIPVGIDRDFWVVEGLACYLESFRIEKSGRVTVGDVDHPRMLAARQLVAKETYEPLARYTEMGMKKFQTGEHEELQHRYAQATGLSHFFMHYQNGIYRDGFIEFMSNLYSPDQRIRSRAKPVYEVLGVPDRTLDEQYIEHIKAMGKVDPDQTAKR